MNIIELYRGVIKSLGKSYLFLLLIMLCGLNLMVMHYYVLHTCKIGAVPDITILVDNLVSISFDVIVLFIITYLLTFRKLRIAIILCFIITWLWSFSTVMYSRFFFHYLSFSAVCQGNSLFDGLIVNCITANFRLIDIYYPCVMVLFVLLLTLCWRKTFLNPLRNLIMVFTLIIVVDFGSYVFYCVSNPPYRYLSCFTHRIYSNHFVKHLYYSNPKLAHFLRGEIRTIYSELLNVINGNIDLSEHQLSEIKRLSSDSSNSLCNNFVVPSSKNVIFILVESYMSFTVDMKIEEKEVTPFLNSLKRNKNVYYNGKMKKNVTIGGSSDGQFIYMTGLLPLRSIITLTKANHVELPGLPKYIGRKSRMIIPTTTSIWNQDEMCRQYGFDSLYARNDYSQELDSCLTDEQVFELAIQKDKCSSQPFFSVILTGSMHQPYEVQIDSTFPIKDTSITDELACYLNACHYTDRQIENYFKYLYESGLYDNSLIVIAADHPVDNTDFGGVCNDIPLFIVNSTGLPEKMWEGECNQVDVYTTLLDLLGCKVNWYGLGHSLVSPKYAYSLSTEFWEVSEWIIMGDYFSKE